MLFFRIFLAAETKGVKQCQERCRIFRVVYNHTDFRSAVLSPHYLSRQRYYERQSGTKAFTIRSGNGSDPRRKEERKKEEEETIESDGGELPIQ